MSVLTYDASRLTANRDRQAAETYCRMFCWALVLLNLSTFLYHFSGSSIFNVISNALGIGLMAYAALRILRSHEVGGGPGANFLLVALVALAPSIVVNLTNFAATDVLKYLSVYVFYAAGRRSAVPFQRFELRTLYALAMLPLLFMVAGSSRVYDSQAIVQAVGYLPNANTAVLYYSALLFAAAPFFGNRVILFQLINAALFNKIGALVATVIAIGMWVALPLRRETIIAGVVLGVAGIVALSLGVFDRALGSFDNLSLIFSLEPSAVLTMSYGNLVQLTGATDLSGFFRLIHWSNIWDIYSSGGIGMWLFGYGAGQTPLLTYAALVPHNDYLRVLAEYGIFSFIVFICFLVHVRRALTTGAAKVLFLVLLIYFFSENLIDNFTSMALFFGYAGRLSAQRDAAAESAKRTMRLELVNRL